MHLYHLGDHGWEAHCISSMGIFSKWVGPKHLLYLEAALSISRCTCSDYGHYAGQFYGHLITSFSQEGSSNEKSLYEDHVAGKSVGNSPLVINVKTHPIVGGTPPLSFQIPSSKKARWASYEVQVKAPPTAHSLFHQLWPPGFCPLTWLPHLQMKCKPNKPCSTQVVLVMGVVITATVILTVGTRIMGHCCVSSNHILGSICVRTFGTRKGNGRSNLGEFFLWEPGTHCWEQSRQLPCFRISRMKFENHLRRAIYYFLHWKSFWLDGEETSIQVEAFCKFSDLIHRSCISEVAKVVFSSHRKPNLVA